tara:strand:- start:404 stop:574 length:171 start_codon:yes stop_codon:yes gene_type:complete
MTGYKGYVMKANDHDQKAAGFKVKDPLSTVRKQERAKIKTTLDKNTVVREGESKYR